MKSLFWGIAIILLAGIGGFIYRNAVEHPLQPVACPLDAKVCPDGTAVGRIGQSCTFPVCPWPNVELKDAGIAFAVPLGFATTTPGNPAMLAVYTASPTASSTATIVVRRYALDASSTPSDVIRTTAIGGASGLPVAVTALSSVQLGGRPYTVASIERFEGVVDTAYYLVRPDQNDILRFDAVDTGVMSWMDVHLDTSSLPAHAALRTLLANLQMLQ